MALRQFISRSADIKDLCIRTQGRFGYRVPQTSHDGVLVRFRFIRAVLSAQTFQTLLS